MEQDNPFVRNLAEVQREIAAAAGKVHRVPADIRLIAVTKTVDATAVAPLVAAGLENFGENRWQQAREKVLLDAARVATWHFIGRLQSNKVKYIVKHFQWIHSVDSVPLAEEISRRAVNLNRVMPCLLEVNASGEASKGGMQPEDVLSFLKTTGHLPGVSIRGLMTMAPNFDRVQDTRPTFVTLRQCLEDARERLGLSEFRELSMGMSNDFAIAIEEGATMVRIGRRLMRGWAATGEER